MISPYSVGLHFWYLYSTTSPSEGSSKYFRPPWEIFGLIQPCSLPFHLDQVLEGDVPAESVLALLMSSPFPLHI